MMYLLATWISFAMLNHQIRSSIDDFWFRKCLKQQTGFHSNHISILEIETPSGPFNYCLRWSCVALSWGRLWKQTMTSSHDVCFLVPFSYVCWFVVSNLMCVTSWIWDDSPQANFKRVWAGLIPPTQQSWSGEILLKYILSLYLLSGGLLYLYYIILYLLYLGVTKSARTISGDELNLFYLFGGDQNICRRDFWQISTDFFPCAEENSENLTAPFYPQKFNGPVWAPNILSLLVQTDRDFARNMQTFWVKPCCFDKFDWSTSCSTSAYGISIKSLTMKYPHSDSYCYCYSSSYCYSSGIFVGFTSTACTPNVFWQPPYEKSWYSMVIFIIFCWVEIC